MIPNLVPRDPVSIGLSRALDLKTLGSEFARALPDAGAIRQVTIDRLKYVPGEKAVLGVCVEREGYTTPLRYGVRIFAQDAVPDRFEKARSQHGLVTPECGDPVIHLPSLNAVAWAFPNDRKMAGISNLLSSDCWPVTGPDLTMEILRYVPEQSCTIRLQSVTAATLFGKTTPACASGRVMGVLSALAQNAAGGVGFARPCAIASGRGFCLAGMCAGRFGASDGFAVPTGRTRAHCPRDCRVSSDAVRRT